MRTLLFLLLTLSALTAHAQIEYGGNGWRNSTVRGNGEVTTQDRQVDGFTEVEACCAFRVELTQGPTAVRVEAESNLQEYVVTEVHGDRLDIHFKDKVSIKSKEDITVYVSTPELTYVIAGAAAKITATSMFEGDRLRLDVSSGARMSMQFTGDELRADANSGGLIEVTGSGRTVDIEASSGATIKAQQYAAKEVDAEASSGAGVEVNVSERLEAEATSGGRVRYHGDAPNININGGSGGSVRKG